MKISLMPCLCLAGAFFALPAWSQVYKCVDAESDHVTYSNVVSKQDSKNCTRLETSQDNVAPAVVRQKTKSASTPSAFPVHISRENDRRAILEQELSSELQSLSQAQKELLAAQNQKGDTKPYEERVAQHQRNVDALNKEIDNLK